MSEKLSLLKKLNEEHQTKSFEKIRDVKEKDIIEEFYSLSESIKYQEYEVELFDSTVVAVKIPLRETENFEKELMETSVLTKEILKEVLRKYRGIRKSE